MNGIEATHPHAIDSLPRSRVETRLCRRRLAICLALPLAVLLAVASLPIGRSDAADPVTLGTAEPFAVLAGAAILSSGASTINGDVGIAPGTTITNGGWTLNGTEHNNDATATQAKVDLASASGAASSPASVVIPTELGGTTITPGVYSSLAGTFSITGTVTLDAQGDPDAVFIFQATTTLVTAPGSAVSFVGGNPCNVIWQTGSAAVIDAGTHLIGNVIATSSITSGAGSEIDGRLLAQNGSVTLDSTTVTAAACTPPPTTTTEAPTTTTTLAPTTTTTEPPTTTTTVAPTTTTTEAPTTTTTTVAPTTTTTEPPTTTTTVAPTTTTTAPAVTTTTATAATTTTTTPAATATTLAAVTTTTDPAATTTTDPNAPTTTTTSGSTTEAANLTAAPVVSASATAGGTAYTGSDGRLPVIGTATLLLGLVVIALARRGRNQIGR